MKIIAFGHRRYTGKDTICKFIKRQLLLEHKGISVNICGFADKLKHVLNMLYSWTGVKSPDYYEDHPKEKDEVILGLRASTGCNTYRELCITFGQYVRKYDDGVWINALLKTKSCDVLLIKDMRFPTEIDAVVQHNGICNRIDRDDQIKFDDEADSALQHETRWDNIYQNNGTLNDLHKIAMSIVKGLTV